MRVLIIDDCPQLLAVARARLARDDHEVAVADGGRAGLEAVRSLRPDLVLLDVDMPDLNGFDLCRQLKSDPELQWIPVIFLTGRGRTAEKIRGLDLGAVDYITKPFDGVELRARVRAALRTKRFQDLVIEHAHMDPLTELPNRRMLSERLGVEWARAARHGGGLSLIMADIDHFKRINDLHGHPVGDRALKAVAGAISSQCRDADLPARYGGEEFAVIVPDESAAGAARLAERCRAAVEMLAVPAGGDVLRLTASFGVSDARSAPNAQALVEFADAALYVAKRTGRNRVECVRQSE